MANYEKKEEQTLKDIAEIVTKLDDYLIKVQTESKIPSKENEVKKWFAQKKAFHEVKRLLHKVNKYEDYQEDELEAAIANFKHLGLDEETVTFLSEYF